MQVGSALLLGDLAIYWGHRFQHQYDGLWHFHAVHHSCEHMDWLAAHRDHPVDGLYTATVTSLPGFMLGVTPGDVSRCSCLPRHVEHLHSLQRASAYRSAADSYRRARAPPLAP
ncbi:MAG: sterol desaturase family protein [Candidatus Methylacidiphilales bacterium]